MILLILCFNKWLHQLNARLLRKSNFADLKLQPSNIFDYSTPLWNCYIVISSFFLNYQRALARAKCCFAFLNLNSLGTPEILQVPVLKSNSGLKNQIHTVMIMASFLPFQMRPLGHIYPQ
ncbi:hypothetical protein BpHYR1_027884 [Brachionus plicatilis]|uniref:Uncharacterized protein n=1 Tax=Brachionus plicatilis TaxID=10195 RepID=A0A3M7RE68_BRAPC|nr:hypothetical protein BpHYR1_027884 [Brachionus plicatilis]